MAEAPHDSAQRRRGRLQMLLLLAIAAAPIVLGTAAFYLWPPSGRTNYGELLSPEPVAAVGVDLRGEPSNLDALRGRWVLLVASAPDCPEACRRNLLFARQVRFAQGRDQGKVERAWIVDGREPPAVELEPLYAGAQVIRVSGMSTTAGLPPDTVQSSQIVLVDPLGRRVLRFPADPDPRRIVKDLQRLLRINRAEYAR